MKSLTTQFIRAVHSAFMRVLCAIPASFLNLKGGGGAETRRTAIACVWGGVFAVFFALPFAAEEANAQTASGHVFTMASEIHDNTATANTEVNLSESVLTIIMSARADLGGIGNSVADDNFGFGWLLRGRGEMSVAAQGTSNDGMTLIFFDRGQGLMQAGDLVIYDEGFTNFEFTVRLYNIGTVLFAADEVREADLNAPADSNAGEFYLLTTNNDNGVRWTMTDTPSEGVFGYIAPNCADEFVLSEDGSICEREAEMPENETTSPVQTERGESDVRENALTAFGGALAIGVLSYLLSDGTLLGYSATPDFGYSITDSGYSVNAGGRVDFHKDRWHLYWTAGQQSVNGDFGDFRYSSGGKWQGDIFAAAFSEKVQGETADYDLSLSANWTGGIWKVSPEFAIDSVYEKGEFATTNSFRINGELRYDDWHFSASGNQTQMELSATLEF